MTTGFSSDACAALGALRPSERSFLSGMKRKECEEVLHDLVHMGRPHDEVPLRLRVLRSDLPRDACADVPRPERQRKVRALGTTLELLLGVVRRARGSATERLERAHRILDANVVGHEEAKCEVLKLASATAAGTSRWKVHRAPGRRISCTTPSRRRRWPVVRAAGRRDGRRLPAGQSLRV